MNINDVLSALTKQLERDNGGPLPPPPLCSWCRDKGCASCFAKRKQIENAKEKEYARLYPNGPEPIFTARCDNQEEMEDLKEIFHADAIMKTFGDGGGGMNEINEKCKRAMKKRRREG